MNNPINVLVIDDDQDDHEIFSGAMSMAYPKALCEFAFNRLEALTKLSMLNNKPDFIFMDLNMPEMEPEEFIQKLRLMPDTEDIAVYTLSGFAPYDQMKYLMQIGVKKVLQKQNTIGQLSTLLRTTIGVAAS
jgi:CheY-like chemotaxis protein